MRPTPILLLTLAVLLSGVSVSWSANIQGPKRSALQKLQEGDAVRNRLLLRDGRFELGPSLGFTLNDAYRRNVLLGVEVDYHLTDSFAIGGFMAYGLAFDSGLTERINAVRGEQVAQGGFSDLTFIGAVEASYVPLFGKVAFMGRYVVNYDFQVSAGVGAASLSGSDDVAGFKPVGVLGAGMRVFLNRWSAVGIQVRDFIYSSALNAVPNTETDTGVVRADASVRNNFSLMVGYSLMIPQEPTVSE